MIWFRYSVKGGKQKSILNPNGKLKYVAPTVLAYKSKYITVIQLKKAFLC